MFERIETVQVSGEDLHRRERGRHDHADTERCPDRWRYVISQDAVCRQSHDEERHCQERRQHRVNHPITEGRVEDDLHPARRMSNAIAHLETGGSVHPGDERQNPERGETGADGHEHRRDRVHAVAYALEAEQHDAEKGRLQEECRQYFISQQRPGDIADRVHEAGPVGTELEAHGNAADDPESEGQREHLHPEPVRIHPFLVSCRVEAQLEEQQHPGEADRDHREQDVEADVCSKLQTREQ